jgi:uncharacterized protein YjiS (DUF1127 family)
MIPGSRDGAAAHPTGLRALRHVVRSIGRLVWGVAIGMDGTRDIPFASVRPLAHAIGAPLLRLALRLREYRERAAERRRLHGFSDHILKDVGLSRRDVEQLARGPRSGD